MPARDDFRADADRCEICGGRLDFAALTVANLRSTPDGTSDVLLCDVCAQEASDLFWALGPWPADQREAGEG